MMCRNIKAVCTARCKCQEPSKDESGDEVGHMVRKGAINPVGESVVD